MIDIQLIKKNEKEFVERVKKKDPNFDSSMLISLSKSVLQFKTEIDDLKAEKNTLSSILKKQQVTDELREKSIQLGKSIKQKEAELEPLEKEYATLLLSCPNILYDDVPLGNKESNKIVKSMGEKPNFSFHPKNHLAINTTIRWFDFDMASKTTGGQFVVFLEQGIKVVYALTQMMLQNNVKHGFLPIKPPELTTKTSLYNSGNLPKFEGDFYNLADDDLALIPTSEVSLTNIHADEILLENDLPIRYTSWTNCFRREAGGYGATDRGLIRIHQFDKVELYSIVQPKESGDEQKRMVKCAEKILQDLGLHYRVSLLAAQDCSFASAKTYDIEVWLPGQNQYYEVSSASNCTDFQARRAKIRYRGKDMNKPHLVYTLNCSSLAIPRLLVAIMETYQQKDGTVKLPKNLQEKMDMLW
jgi:seryl-tRNA synthetase